jgi:phosphoglucomutase/phosphomannomutase
MARMRELMGRLRTEPPRQIAGLQVSRIRDFERGLIIDPAGRETPAELPQGDMVILDLESEGNYVAIRPSGTEPKVKFYAFAYEPAEMLANLEDTKAELQTRLGGMTSDLATYADQTSDA